MSMIIHDELKSVARDWLELEALPTASVHQGMAWSQAWTDAAKAQVCVLDYTHHGSRIILPLEVKRAAFARIARPLGTTFSNLNLPLADLSPAFDPEHFLRSLAHALTDRADLLIVDSSVMSWRGQDNPLNGMSRIPRVNPSFQLELEVDMHGTLAKLDAKKRMKMFRTSERKLAAAGGWHYEVVTDPAEATATLEIFFAQKETRFRKLGLPNPFAETSARAFFRRLVTAEESRTGHVLRLHALRLRDRHGPPIAIAGISTKGDYAITQFGSVDDTVVVGASPGEFLYHLVIERLCAQGFKLFDFGVGDQPYKRRWCNVETQQFDFILPLDAVGTAFAHFTRVVSETKRFIKARPQVYKTVQALRARFRSGGGGGA